MQPCPSGIVLRPAIASSKTYHAYIDLFRTCFPHSPISNLAYLHWLYEENPAGPVVGFDAWDGDVLAAHYTCIPVETILDGIPCRCLLSLNTATAPAYQGQGLFVRLAQATYDNAACEGYAAVYGVGNANSTPGLLRKLAFQAVAPLQAMVGLGRVSRSLGWERAVAAADFRRRWTPRNVAWRIQNPLNPVKSTKITENLWGFSASARRFGIQAYGECWVEDADGETLAPTAVPVQGWRPRVFLGLLPPEIAAYGGYVNIPQRLKASPLNLVYRRLGSGPERLDPRRTLFSFLEFDAF